MHGLWVSMPHEYRNEGRKETAFSPGSGGGGSRKGEMGKGPKRLQFSICLALFLLKQSEANMTFKKCFFFLGCGSLFCFYYSLYFFLHLKQCFF